ncbi:hypothetical protein M8C21_003975, partial [Ambrosia artemisiifolia]
RIRRDGERNLSVSFVDLTIAPRIDIKDGEVKKVHNMDSHGRPSPKFKRLEEIYQHAEAEYTSLHLAERETRERNSDVVEEYEHNVSSNENNLEELTLSQIKKKLKRKKTKSLETILLTPKAEDDDFDLTEPLCKFRVKVSKSSQSKRVSANGNSPTSSRSAQLVTSELNEDLTTVKIKVEDPEVEYFESSFDLTSGKSELFTNEGETCEFNEASCDEIAANVNQPPMVLGSQENGFFVMVPTASASDCSRSQFFLQQTSEHINISAVQDSTPTIDDEHNEDVVSMEAISPISEENKTSTSINTDADSDSFNLDSISTVSEDISIHQELISTVSANADPDSFNSDNISVVSEDISIRQELISTVSANAGSEVKLDHIDKPSVVSEASEVRQTERLPLTRKFISPNSQKRLCLAMKSAESLDDIDHFKCKEKLYFGEQAETKFSPTKSDVEDNKLNLHPQQATQPIQNKVVISSKQVLKRPRSFKKGSPTKKGIAPKGCLDGPRLCRSLPRLSSGCTSIEGCSESAVTFSQRQMHDFESLASKLLSELNSMKTIVEEKMLYEAYRSTSLKNEADEVKSVIKSATKTEETAKKWLSMMARDCNRFCKIMKLNEDHNTSASGDPAVGNSIPEKPLEREKKKISFADEAGGTLCDIKVYQIDQESSLPLVSWRFCGLRKTASSGFTMLMYIVVV